MGHFRSSSSHTAAPLQHSAAGRTLDQEATHYKVHDEAHVQLGTYAVVPAVSVTKLTHYFPPVWRAGCFMNELFQCKRSELVA